MIQKKATVLLKPVHRPPHLPDDPVRCLRPVEVHRPGELHPQRARLRSCKAFCHIMCCITVALDVDDSLEHAGATEPTRAACHFRLFIVSKDLTPRWDRVRKLTKSVAVVCANLPAELATVPEGQPALFACSSACDVSTHETFLHFCAHEGGSPLESPVARRNSSPQFRCCTTGRQANHGKQLTRGDHNDRVPPHKTPPPPLPNTPPASLQTVHISCFSWCHLLARAQPSPVRIGKSQRCLTHCALRRSSRLVATRQPALQRITSPQARRLALPPGRCLSARRMREQPAIARCTSAETDCPAVHPTSTHTGWQHRQPLPRPTPLT